MEESSLYTYIPIVYLYIHKNIIYGGFYALILVLQFNVMNILFYGIDAKKIYGKQIRLNFIVCIMGVWFLLLR